MNDIKKIDALQKQVINLLAKGDDQSFYKAIDINKEISELMKKEYVIKGIL